jgi:acetyl-CoA C-acetyltransferase
LLAHIIWENAMSDRTPVIVGAAQITIAKGSQPGPEPLDLWEQSIRLAADDAGIAFAELKATQYLGNAYCLGWNYDNQAARLAERLGATPQQMEVPSPSGTTGLKLMKHACDAIRAGADIAVVCGGEAIATQKYYQKNGDALPFSHPARDESNRFVLEDQQHPGEGASGLLGGVGAVYTFGMRDNARRAHLGIAPDAYRRQNAELLSAMSRVAAANPHAWFPQAKSVEFLYNINDDNRLIAYPYSKHNVSIMDVDMSAAQIVLSKAKADALGIPEDKRVYPWTYCYADDPVDTAPRADLWRSPAMAAASKAVLEAAGVSIDKVNYIDLYSCFPAAVNFARDALGISDRPGDQVTLTGGLPYAGGPAASYVCTSITKLVDRLKADRDGIGLISGLGMMMSNHCYGLFGTRPLENLAQVDEAAVQAALDAIPLKLVRTDYTGPCTIATYTTIHDRNGDATAAAAIVDLPDGSRAYARILDEGLIAEAIQIEMIGRKMEMAEAGAAGLIRAA